jgi:type I restriction enzyme S subunit
MSLVQTGEHWLGTLPTDWISSRIRNVAQLSPSYSNSLPVPDDLCTVVPMELLSESGAIDVTMAQPFEDINAGLTMFEAGDVLFAKITPCMENGKGGVRWKPPDAVCFRQYGISRSPSQSRYRSEVSLLLHF